jgi:hypothetical protein
MAKETGTFTRNTGSISSRYIRVKNEGDRAWRVAGRQGAYLVCQILGKERLIPEEDCEILKSKWGD